MKKLLWVILLAFSNLISYAPDTKSNFNESIQNTAFIAVSEVMRESYVIYNPLIDAIFFIESSRDTSAYNSKENAVGGLQIRQCRIDHYNKLTNKNYTLKDMYDFDKAKEVFLYFTDHDWRGNQISQKSFEKAAKDWNGKGPKTIDYWNKVSAILNTA